LHENLTADLSVITQQGNNYFISNVNRVKRSLSLSAGAKQTIRFVSVAPWQLSLFLINAWWEFMSTAGLWLRVVIYKDD
jgi:hypothetical protein